MPDPAFEIPQAALEQAAADPRKCDSQAPDQWTVECQLQHGHDGPHRNNMVVWTLPQPVYVGGVLADTTVESERWQGGRVLLFDDAEPDL
jgi:hypothetical protein